ncbi:21749_t:CDS:2 [Gigaspora margarita]|uniref:21749_t:CDS:1 n=1 Tax=Gigaspora margarita TaxID=4874 RepID=A0ABN7UPU7_GIGMA|nr:21749_t:CDS:2 [Gigaspora margarita]
MPTQLSLYEHVDKKVRSNKRILIKYEELKQTGDDDSTLMKWGSKLIKLKKLRNVKKCNEKDVMRLNVELDDVNNKIDHPNVLKVFGLTHDKHSNCYYFVREYTNSGDLRHYLRQTALSKSPLSWNEKLELVRQVVVGLKCLHDQSIVHAELHPCNIFVHDGVPKLANIAVSKVHNPHNLSFTQYTPPEILLNKEYPDLIKLNIYSLGVLMWEICNDGTAPFLEDYTVSLVFDIIRGVRESPKVGTPQEFINLYQRCWDHNPDVRPNCSEILEELKNIIQQVKDHKYQNLEKQTKLQIKFINNFGLNKARNLGKFDITFATKTLLGDHGDLEMTRLKNQEPIIIIPRGEMNYDQEIPPEYDIIRLHFPTVSVKYKSDVKDQFTQEIINALSNPNDNEKTAGLRKTFNEWGNFTVNEVIIGGAITIKNWSKISNENKSRLKTYIQWGIDYARCGKSPVFNDALLSDFPKIETSKKDMKTIGEFYEWLKDIYNYKYAEIISYENLRPSYKLLDDDLVKHVFQVLAIQPPDRPFRKIPQIPTPYDQQTFLEWIKIPMLPLLLYMRDWIDELFLKHGILLKRSHLGRVKKACLKFSKEPNIKELNNIAVLLMQPPTQQEAYLLNNGIIIKESDELDLKNIPFLDDVLEFSHPLEDFQNPKKPSRTIYCQIIAKMAKISFDLEKIKPLEQVSEIVNISLESYEPYKNLCELFSNNYGHLVPRTLILGGKLSVEFTSYDDSENTIDTTQTYNYDKFDASEIKQILTGWDDKYKRLHVNTKLFTSDGDIVKRDNIENWWNNLKNNPNKWRIVSYEDWTPLYKILKKTQSKDIKKLLSDQNHIVFNGEESLKRNDQTVITIKFPGSIDNDYQIYGSAVKKSSDGSWENIPDIRIRFKHTNKYGCVAVLHKSRETKINHKELRILWFVISNPRGYYSNKYRNIKIACGKQNIYSSQTDISLKCNDLNVDYILVTSFTSQSQNDTSFYQPTLKSWSTTSINLEIKKELSDDELEQPDYNDEESNLETSGEEFSDDEAVNTSDQFPQEMTTVHWCIIYTNGDELADNNEIFPLNIFGITLESSLKQDHGITFIKPYHPPMSFEEATKQHTIPNGNTLDAWSLFVYKAFKNDFEAKYWVGFYLQNDILRSSDFYNPEEVLEGLTIQEASMKFYKSAADNGHAEAQLRYGFGLYNGQGVQEDKQMAMAYFEKSANNGNHVAMYNLGALLYINGKDKEKGKDLLIRAAKLGHQKAIDYCSKHKINYKN